MPLRRGKRNEMRIRQKEIQKLHKRREERYKALHKGQATPAASTGGVSARAGAGGRTSTGGSGSSGSATSGSATRSGVSAPRPPRRPAGPPTEG